MTEKELAAVMEGIAPIVRECLAKAMTDTVAQVTALRDRVLIVETKTATVGTPDPTLSDLRDRLVTLETRTAGPSTADMAVVDLRTRLSTIEARLADDTLTRDIGAVRERVIAVETKSDQPDPVLHDRLLAVEHRTPTRELWDALTANVTDLRTRLDAIERRVGDETATKELGTVRERIAVLETRAPVPGPPGKDGSDGKAGADGLGFEDLDVEFDGDRTLSLKFARNGTVKTFPIAIPFLRYQGVYIEGKSYDVGDVVTWAGSTWNANEATSTKPGDGSKAWTLVVKRGRDGRDGRDAPSLPVVSVGGRS